MVKTQTKSGCALSLSTFEWKSRKRHLIGSIVPDDIDFNNKFVKKIKYSQGYMIIICK